MKQILLKEDYHIWIVLLFSAIIYFIGNSALSISDPVESNYALTAKEMLLQGNYLSPQIFNHYWYDKPIFFYWEVIIGFKLFGISNFGARFFSSLLALCNLFLVYRFVKAVSTHTTAITSTIILATTIEYWIIAKAVITDMTLGLCFNATLMSFYIGYIRHKENLPHYKQYYYIAYIASAFAVLTKGPIGFLLPGLIILIYLGIRHDFQEFFSLQILSGIAILLTLSGGWYYYMYAVHGNDFINVFLGVHNWLRATVSEHPRYNVWYYYLPVSIIALFPWSLILLKTIYTNRNKWFIHNRLHSFLLIWAGTVIIFFSLIATKYTTYTFPALPPIVISMALIYHKHLIFICKTALVISLTYIVLTFIVAVPQMNQASSSTISSYIIQSIPTDAIIIQGNGRYRVSTTYYSGHTIYKLLDTHQIPPDTTSLSWDAKEIMPFLSIDDLPTDKDVYMLTYNHEFPSTLNKADWVQVYSDNEGSIYLFHH